MVYMSFVHGIYYIVWLFSSFPFYFYLFSFPSPTIIITIIILVLIIHSGLFFSTTIFFLLPISFWYSGRWG